MTATSAIESDINPATGRYIERSPRGDTWALFTFNRPSDETYQFVTSDIATENARSWLAGGSLHTTSEPKTVRLEATLTAIEVAQLRELAATGLPTAGQRKLTAALDVAVSSL